MLGDVDLLASEGGLVDVADAKVGEALGRLLQLLARRHLLVRRAARVRR